MSVIDELIEGIKAADALVELDELEPSRERTDWSSAAPRIAELQRLVQEQVLGVLDAAAAEGGDPLVVEVIHRRVAALLAEAAAALAAAGHGRIAQAWLAKAEKLCPDEEERAELAAAQAEPELHACLVHARWLHRRRRYAETARLCRRIARQSKQRALIAAARKAARAPRPLDGKPPSLFQLNGCGTGLYGSRDRWPDGSSVATLCIALVFIPVFPLAAYRVQRVDERTYRFMAKEHLSTFARGYQLLLALGVVAAIAVSAVASYLDSPSRHAALALREAQAVEAGGHREQAMERYKALVESYYGRADVSVAAQSFARLAAAGIPAPCTRDALEPARRAVAALASLPETARRGEPVELLGGRLAACAAEVGDVSLEQARAALALLELARTLGGEGPEASRIQERRATASRALGDRVADARPLLALDLYLQSAQPQALDAAKHIVDAFGDAPSLWLEAEPLVGRWLEQAERGGRGSEAAAVRAKLAAARDAHARDEALVAAGDEKALVQALGERPGDQELAVALAGMRRSKGDAQAAKALLVKLGAPGRLTAAAQQVLASCEVDLGDLAAADAVLSALLDERLPAFQLAQQAYAEASDALQRKVLDRLKAGVAPPELETKLGAAVSDADKRAVLEQWISDELDKDAKVAALRVTYLQHAEVVPVSLSLGIVKLRRASEASGDQRRALLSAAEQTFLAIRREAAGEPSFHLALGQVYHRLGKATEGEAELQGVLARSEPVLDLEVARTYRELGLFVRARQVAEKVYQSATVPELRYSAADLLAHLAPDVDEEEKWFKLGDPASPGNRNNLLRVEAQRLLLNGKLAEADRKFAEVARFFERSAERDPVAANNAAMAYGARYEATGDVEHLRKAVAQLEASARLGADNALILGNLAGYLERIGVLRVLERWLDGRTLILDSDSARGVVASMVDGPLRDELLAALRQEVSFQRALEVGRQQQVLAPQMVDAYGAQRHWLAWNADAKALEELLHRLEGMPAPSVEDSAAERAAWLKGEKDELGRRTAQQAVAAARRRLERAQKGSKSPTQAVAWLSLGQALGAQLFFDPTPDSVAEMVAAARKAHELWPEGVSAHVASDTLLLGAFFKAELASPALAKLWQAERRTLHFSVILHHASLVPEAAEISTALRQQPELREAAELLKAATREAPTLDDWVLARAAGDGELERLAAKAFDRADLGAEVRIALRLEPGDEGAKATLELYTSRGQAH